MSDIGMRIGMMTESDVTSMLDEAVEAMINTGCLIIQDRIGQTDGGLADHHFTDEKRDVLYEMMRQYFLSEKMMEAV
jgi:hypothetical protein